MDFVSQAQVQCPFCWEAVEFPIDSSFGSYEEVVDCPVCCRPMDLSVTISGNEIVSVKAEG